MTAGSGSRPALDSEELWRQWAGRLRAFIAARIDDADAVDDVLQTVFVRVHRGVGEVRDADRVVGWLHRIARNAVVDYYRSAPRRRELPSDDLPADPDGEAAPGADPSDRAGQVRAEMAACLEPLLAELAPGDRQALEITELEGLTQRAAAARLGLSVPGMKSRVQRARRRLHAQLHECCVLALDARGEPIACTPRCPDCG